VNDADCALPHGAVLLHIGPYKTGTTAIQSALHQHRDDLRDHDVLYPGTARRQVRPVFGLTGTAMPGVREVPPEAWDRLVDEVIETAPARTVLSSEDLVRASSANLDRIVSDFGRDHVHVLMVARPLHRLLPSAWQQRVKSINEARGYDEWLREVLDPDRAGESAKTFWRNQSTAYLITEWIRVIPPEQVTVVVADPSDRGQLRAVVEEMLGLPAGLLTEGPQANTSLTWERVELYRLVNRVFKDRGWDLRSQRRLLHDGMLRTLRNLPVGRETPLPSLFPWAVERVAELGAEQADQIAASGVNVVGDLAWLRMSSEPGVTDAPTGEPTTIPVATAARALEGLIGAIVEPSRGPRRRRKRGAIATSRRAGTPVPTAPTRALVGELARRLSPRRARRSS
jgi:hypothetical protein